MRYKATILVALILSIAFVNNGRSEEQADSNCGIIYGENHSFSVCAPKGWVLDNKSGIGQGLHAVFYPKGNSWRNSSVVMYMNWAAKDEAIQNIDSLVQFNLSTMKNTGSPNVNARFIKTIKNEHEKEGHIWEFSGDQWGNFEWLCYFEEKHGIAIAVLSSRDKEDFEASKMSLTELCKSYFFLTKNVKY